LENEFIKNGKTSVFHKKAVKICTYSSKFGGRNNAMKQAILDYFRKEIGLTVQQFKICPEFENFSKIANGVTYEMQKSSRVSDFKEISYYVKKTYIEDKLIGPTGHKYRVDEHSFKNCFANSLQSYEKALLSQSTLNLLHKHPTIPLIAHFHDGNILPIPIDRGYPIIEDFNKFVFLIGEYLGLKTPQTIQVNKIY